MSYVNRGSILAIGITFIPLSILTVSARFYTRVHHGGLGTDDWLCLVALILVLGACGVMIDGYATHSLGTHTPHIGPAVFTLIDPSQQQVKRLQYVIYFLFVPAVVLIKLSILSFYRRIFRGKVFIIAFWILSTLSVIWGITFFTAFAAACTNVQDNFTSVLTLKTRCINTFKVQVAQSILDVITDLAILILPIPFVFALQMPLKRKVVVSCTLVVGALAISCGIARMVVIIEALSIPLFSKATVAGLETDDAKGIVSALCIWSVLEIGVGIVAICLPTFQPLLKTQSLESVVRGFRSVISISSRSSSKQAKSIDSAESSLESGPSDDVFDGRTGKFVVSATFDVEKAAHRAHSQVDPNLDKSKITVEKTVRLESISR